MTTPVKKTQVKKVSERLYCRNCQKTQSETNYYEAVSLLDSNGKMSICKKCIGEIYNKHFKKSKDLTTSIYRTCKDVDVMFNEQALQGLKNHLLGEIEKGRDLKTPFGTYKSKLSTTCKKHVMGNMIFANSEDMPTDPDDELDDYEYDNKDLRVKWGDYPNDTLIRFKRKYDFLRDNYNEKTSMHTEAIYKYVRYSVLEETANEKEDTSAAKIYNDLANKAATAAKINPSQLSKADLMDGLNSFSELSSAVERAVDVVKILPKFKYRANDALDFTIWCYINYERNLNGLEEVPYEDVYAFYDRKVEEYVEQYGDPYELFKDDPTVKNRESIKKFIVPFKDGSDE